MKIGIDRQGKWFHDNQPIEHTGVLAAFQRGLRRLADGRYILQIADDWRYVEVEDTPLLVEVVFFFPTHVVLEFSDHRRENLRPDTLNIREGVLYCETELQWPARFGRSAQFSLGSQLEEKEGEFVLFIGGKSFSFS